MNTKFIALVCVCMFFAAVESQASAIAQNTEEYRIQGNLELNSEAGTGFGLALGYGYFSIDYFETGVFGGYSEDDIITDIYGGAFGEYHLETGTELVPFGGVALSLHNTELDLPLVKDSATAIVLGVYVGTKYFLSDTTALSLRLLLEAATEDIYADNDDPADTNFTIDLGFSFFY